MKVIGAGRLVLISSGFPKSNLTMRLVSEETLTPKDAPLLGEVLAGAIGHISICRDVPETKSLVPLAHGKIVAHAAGVSITRSKPEHYIRHEIAHQFAGQSVVILADVAA